MVALGLVFVAANANGIINRQWIAANDLKMPINRAILRNVTQEQLVDANVRENILGIVVGAAIYLTGAFMVVKWLIHAGKAWFS